MRVRREIGLFAFFYATLHFLTYLVLDQFFDWQDILKDIGKRPFIMLGFSAFVLLIPLAITSTNAMVKRLGAKRWQRLHRSIYVLAAFAVAHFWWLVKKDITEPFIFAVLLATLLIARLLIFGLASLGSAFAGSLGFMEIMRFFTGLGIGGAFPGAATLAGDYAPHRRRALMIMISFTGAPLGGFLCGQLAGVLLPTLGWPSVFVIGGVFPLVLVAVMAVCLPESPRFLAAKASLSPRQAALLQRLDIAPGQGVAHGLDLAQGNPFTPVIMLFSKGYALQTVLLWVIFFCSLMNLFLFVYWLPEVLHLTGMTPPEAARATSFRELGAIAAVLYLGVLIDRFGPERALAANYAAGILFIAAIALFAMPYLLLVVVIFFSGMAIIGSQTGANAACGKLYPARMRTSGLGWALGIGRLGGIAAPVLGGWLLSIGLPPRQIFLSACGFALIAAVATALLALRPQRAQPLAGQPAQ